MELQFTKSVCRCLNWKLRDIRVLEETQEVRLPETCSDVGRVISAWGQWVLRSKEWRGNVLSVSGGVMSWVLCEPEDGSDPVCAEAWIPFQAKWDLPGGVGMGCVRVDSLLRDVDARILGGHRLMVRSGVQLRVEALEELDMCLYKPETTDPDIQLLKRTYPMRLPREAGEKIFSVEEEIPLPQPVPETILSYELQPRILEQKMIGNRLVFRGVGNMHLLYRCSEGRIHCLDSELPFSQFAEAEGEFTPEADAESVPVVTSLEVALEDEGIRVKCGMTNQYLISDEEQIELVEDGYSTTRNASPIREEILFPSILDVRQDGVQLEETIGCSCGQWADIRVYPGFPEYSRQEEKMICEIPALARLLYYDEEGILRSETTLINGREEWFLTGQELPEGRIDYRDIPELRLTGSGVSVTARIHVRQRLSPGELHTPLRGMELTEKEGEEDRPSILIRRTGEESLWELAKATGSTVDAIRKANDLQNDPEPGKILLIPLNE